MKAIIWTHIFSLIYVATSSKWYEPTWSGVRCNNDDTVDVGNGPGSCNSDCDCPSCAPFCNNYGYCKNNENTGRRRILKSECKKDSATTASPPPLGSIPPPGCNKTFVEDVNGVISCNDNLDCPQSPDYWDEIDEDLRCSLHDVTIGYCFENKCSFQSTNCGQWYWCVDDNFHLHAGFPGNLVGNNRNPQLLKGYKCNSNKECNMRVLWYGVTDEFYKMMKMQCDSGSCVSKQSHLFMESPKLEYDNGDVYGLKVFGVEIPMCAKFGEPSTGVPPGVEQASGGHEPGYFTPAAGTSKVVQNCLNCRALTCPPTRPCKLGNKCYKPKYNRRGISWCPIFSPWSLFHLKRQKMDIELYNFV